MQTGTKRVTRWRFARRVLVALGLSLAFAWIIVTAIATGEPMMRTQPEFGPGLISMSNDFQQGSFAGSRACGWPFRSHKYSFGASWTTPSGSSASVTSVDYASGGYIVGWEDTMATWPIVIPYRPLWPGFALNLLLAAMVIFVPALLIARRPIGRARLGHCPSCNYDLRGLTNTNPVTCPECGRSIRNT
jgi:hypothetical protein